ncbi:MAG: saccharopine dehydrogenase [Bacteroidetes bacterium]|nr:MAG: saccharopine dehydrogenase [Bacteroidota bacterium]
MKTILILGAGLSSSSLIRYLLQHAGQQNWQVRIVDQNIESVQKKIASNPHGVALSFDALNPEERRPEIERADLVISMLPARFHVDVAKDCIELKTKLITPSYISKEMQELDQAAKEAGILIMNEIGVDPGIDHMSAAKIIDEIKHQGGKITCFKSYCGGLIAPEYDNNPWHYKFTWNPRNVVLAGFGGAAKYIEQGLYKFIPYHELFNRLDHIEIEGYGSFDGYANRDSLLYRSIYGLDEIPTIFRGTLRRPGFCQAWNILVNLGMTDDSYVLENSERLTPRQFLNTFLPYDTSKPVEYKFDKLFTKGNKQLYDQFDWVGLFENDEAIGIENASPAILLQHILQKKLVLDPEDKDMIVMYHLFRYELDGQELEMTSSMVNIGENQVYTSMSNTVGLPVAICSKLILQGKIPDLGVQIPIKEHVYQPILDELEELGIGFKESWPTLKH